MASEGFGLVKWIARIGNALAIVAGISILILMLFTTVDVGMRAAFGSGIAGSIEITQVALVATVFAGMMSAELSKIHVRTPLLTERLPNGAAFALKFFGSLISALVVGWATFYSWRVAFASYAAGEFQFGLAAVPIWPAKIALAIGLTGLLVSCLLDLYLSTTQPKPSHQPQQSFARGQDENLLPLDQM
jgi:TRAP-type C4-dicarboxylate transport system permease small subunit